MQCVVIGKESRIDLMMSFQTFNIEKEKTIQFSCGNVLYVSKIHVGNKKYLLELSDRKRCIGRRKAHNEEVVDGMFKIFFDNYKRQDSYAEAIKTWQFAFSLQKNLEFIFVLRVSKRKVDQNIIGQLIEKYALKVESEMAPKVNDGPEPMTIKLFFPSRKSAIGVFVGHFLKSDFIFQVSIVNE